MKRLIIRKKIITMFLILFIQTAYSAKLDIPARIQVGMFKKIFNYNPKLKEKSFLKLLIVYSENYQIDMEKMKEAFNNASIDCDALLTTQFAEQYINYDIVYFMPGLENLSSNIDKNKVLTISGSSKGIKKGLISVGLDLVKNQPRIFINKSSLKEENHKFSANLMKIAIVN